ncbi:hypothetical protein Hanom_Chr07g00601341 [Helianthus anomalus]
MKSIKIRDPLIHNIHRVLSGSLFQRDNSGGVVNLRELAVLYCLVTHKPIDAAHILFQNMVANATADSQTSIFYGGWIARLFKHFIQRTPLSFNKGFSTTKVDLAVFLSINVIIDCPDSTMRFKDARGTAWNPNDLEVILAIEDIPNRPRPGQFQGSSSQGGTDFPNLMNLYNIMQETRQVSENAYNLGQSSSTRIGSMERNILSMQNYITYIRDQMVVRDEDDEEEEEEEEEDEGQQMDSNSAVMVVGDVVVMQVKSLTL